MAQSNQSGMSQKMGKIAARDPRRRSGPRQRPLATGRLAPANLFTDSGQTLDGPRDKQPRPQTPSRPKARPVAGSATAGRPHRPGADRRDPAPISQLEPRPGANPEQFVATTEAIIAINRRLDKIETQIREIKPKPSQPPDQPLRLNPIQPPTPPTSQTKDSPSLRSASPGRDRVKPAPQLNAYSPIGSQRQKPPAGAEKSYETQSSPNYPPPIDEIIINLKPGQTSAPAENAPTENRSAGPTEPTPTAEPKPAPTAKDQPLPKQPPAEKTELRLISNDGEIIPQGPSRQIAKPTATKPESRQPPQPTSEKEIATAHIISQNIIDSITDLNHFLDGHPDLAKTEFKLSRSLGLYVLEAEKVAEIIDDPKVELPIWLNRLKETRRSAYDLLKPQLSVTISDFQPDKWSQELLDAENAMIAIIDQYINPTNLKADDPAADLASANRRLDQSIKTAINQANSQPPKKETGQAGTKAKELIDQIKSCLTTLTASQPKWEDLKDGLLAESPGNYAVFIGNWSYQNLQSREALINHQFNLILDSSSLVEAASASPGQQDDQKLKEAESLCRKNNQELIKFLTQWRRMLIDHCRSVTDFKGIGSRAA